MATAIRPGPFPIEAETPAGQDIPATRRALVVLGMHRSGTSALTRVLGLSGAALPSHLLPAEDSLPTDSNRKSGFWESKPLLRLHEEAFASAGSKWDDVAEIPASWFETDAAGVFARKLVETLTAEFGNAPVFVAKDPRISRLLPIWELALKELEAEANWVIAVRNPLEVAASLNRRDGFSQPKGLLLWLSYMLAAERYTRERSRTFVLYDHLLNDWREVVSRIEAQFGFSFARRSNLAASEIDAFLDHRLRNYSLPASELATRADVTEWVKSAYDWTVQAAGGNVEGADRLDAIHRALHEAETVYGPLFAEAERKGQRLAELEAAVSDYERELAERSDELTARDEALTRAGAELEAFQQREQQRQEEAARAQEQLDRLHLEITDRDQGASQLQDRLDQIQQELTLRDQKLAEARSELEALQQRALEQRDEAARTEKRLNQQITQLRHEIVLRDQNLDRAQTDLEELRNLSPAHQAEISSMRQESREAVERLSAELERVLERSVEREDKLGEALAEVEDDVRSLRQRLESQRASESGRTSSRVKVLAFYLPQFHPIPENDRWWGQGFTEWTNVTRARPCFDGHQQPLLPSELGFYDLRIPEVRSKQAALARDHGIHGFCYYYYWFHGKKLLERPLQEMLASGEPDFPFCICWANENWTRRWDGEDQDILIGQEHSPETDAAFIDDVLPALRDPRYVTKNGKPLLLVYRADLLADPLATTAAWREAAHRAGLPGLHLCTVWRVDDPTAIGFDARVEFPPHYFPHVEATDSVEGLADDFEGEIFDYAAGVEAIEPLEDEGFPVYRGVMPGWDNTPRRGRRASIFAHSTPEIYARWLEKVTRESAARPGDDDQFVYVNAWNEWAEGAALEPSRTHKRNYLVATKTALERAADTQTELRKLEVRIDGRLERLGNATAELKSSLQETQRDARHHYETYQTALDWLRDATHSFGARLDSHDAWLRSHGGAVPELQTEVARLRQTVESVMDRTDGLQRLSLDRAQHPVTRELWLSLDYGLLGLILKLPVWLLGFRLKSRLGWWRTARRVVRSGLFDPDFYRQRYPEVGASGIDPLYHYVRYGAAEGRDPNPFTSDQGSAPPRLEAEHSGDDPLLRPHDRGAGRDRPAPTSGTPFEGGRESMAVETAVPSPRTPPAEVRWTLNQDQLEKRGDATTPVLFVGHDAARAGSQIYLLEVLRSFARFRDLELYLLLRSGGELKADYERYAHVLDVENLTASWDSEERAVAEAVQAIGELPGVAVCNTAASGVVARILGSLGIPILSIVHELPTTIESLGLHTIHDVVDASEEVIVVSEFVKSALVGRFSLPADRLRVLYVGVTGWHTEDESRDAARRRIFESYGLPEDAALVLGCGSIHHRKGTDLFVQVAREAILDHGLDHVYFMWVGGDEQGPLFRSWCEHDVDTFGLRDRILFAGQQESTTDYYLAADVFLLPSREDPFPLVNLEALARGLPVVAFRDAGGAQEALDDDAGILVPYLDTAEMTRAVVRLVEAPRYRAEIGRAAADRARERYRWDRFIDELAEVVRGRVAVPSDDRSATA